MSKRGINFFEAHVEKLVLGLASLLSLWLFVIFVLMSPNNTEYNNKKLGPGAIDNYISEEARILEDRLNRAPEAGKQYQSQLDNITAFFESAISGIDVSLYPPVPPNISREISDNRTYSLPVIGEFNVIGEINDVEVEHIRAVAYLPTEEISEEKTYETAEHEPNDIDLITVEASFDLAILCDNFYESFNGDSVKKEWRDPCLARPIFAAVELQRQELLIDDTWSKWKVVPRTKIDHHKRLFEVIESADKLPAGGIEVRMLQFDSPTVQADLLQPEAYKIASAKEEWFPPLLYRDFKKFQKEADEEERRLAKAAKKEERERENLDRGGRTSRTRAGSGGGMGMPPGMGMGSPFGGGGGGPFGGGGGGAPSAIKARKPIRKAVRRDRRTERKTEKTRQEKSKKEDIKTVSDIYKEFKGIRITAKNDVHKMDGPLTFWAHDDSAEPGHSYRYKIRLGVFNPLAGTEKLAKEFESIKNNTILWSDFSDTTEVIDIPERLCFFPTEISQNAETVTMQVFRYALGYWYSTDFKVKQGEEIGKAASPDLKEKEEDKDITVPKKIDYSTGAVLVDVVGPVKDWAGKRNLSERYYYDALYSFDGSIIERMPVKSRYWADDIQTKFNELRRLEKEPKEPLRAWDSRTGERGLRPTMPPGMGLPPGMGMPPGMGLPPGMGMPPGY